MAPLLLRDSPHRLADLDRGWKRLMERHLTLLEQVMSLVFRKCHQLIASLSVEERPSQVEVTMERNSFKFLQYVAYMALAERS
jgi:hypothetical protein